MARYRMGSNIDIEEVAKHIVDGAIKVHRAVGPGLLESAYQQCLIYELRQRGLEVKHELILPGEIIYRKGTKSAKKIKMAKIKNSSSGLRKMSLLNQILKIFAFFVPSR